MNPVTGGNKIYRVLLPENPVWFFLVTFPLYPLILICSFFFHFSKLLSFADIFTHTRGKFSVNHNFLFVFGVWFHSVLHLRVSPSNLAWPQIQGSSPSISQVLNLHEYTAKPSYNFFVFIFSPTRRSPVITEICLLKQVLS